jgi:dehydrogenase/reductase SDR family member 12
VTVHLVCRSRERGEEALQSIRSESGNERVHLHIADISRPDSIKSFAEDFQRRQDSPKRLDILVNNAGVLPSEYETVAGIEGGGVGAVIEQTFATNTLGTYLMTKYLLPLMRETALKSEPNSPPRVINVSSGGAYTVKLDPVHLQFTPGSEKFDGSMIYAQTKRQQIVLTEQMAKEENEGAVKFYSCHPGWADTPGVRTSIPKFHETYKKQLRSAQEGSDTIVWLCLSDEAGNAESGQFWFDRQIAPKHLWMAGTAESPQEAAQFMQNLRDNFVNRFLTQ